MRREGKGGGRLRQRGLRRQRATAPPPPTRPPPLFFPPPINGSHCFVPENSMSIISSSSGEAVAGLPRFAAAADEDEDAAALAAPVAVAAGDAPALWPASRVARSAVRPKPKYCVVLWSVGVCVGGGWSR